LTEISRNSNILKELHTKKTCFVAKQSHMQSKQKGRSIMPREYKIKLKRGVIFTAFKNLLKGFKKKPQIVYLGEDEVENQAIFIANHSAASGPLTYELFFPKYFIPWGTHEMCGNYKMRWNYLYHIFYRQKLKYSRVKSFILATTFGLISKFLYNATGLIGTYKDNRLTSTFKRSFQVLDKKLALLIFPEDSSHGYHEKPTAFFKGFLSLSKLYFKKSQIDLPIYNVYFSKAKNKLVIDKPVKINEMLNQGISEEQISHALLNRSHQLFDEHIS
jgi:hypothetical protein